MKQTIEERRLHHQTREDRQRRAYEVNVYRAQRGGRFNAEAANRDAAILARKLNIET